MPSDRLPPWSGDFARQALANALGTLIAVLVIFLGGVLLGAIRDVPTSSVLAAVGALISALVAVFSGSRLVRALPHFLQARHHVRQARAALDDVQELRAQRNDLAFKLDAARAAYRQGQSEEGERLIAEVEDKIAAVRSATDRTRHHTEQGEAHVANTERALGRFHAFIARSRSRDDGGDSEDR